jgi:uncharacterized protein (DUF1786 family)
MRILAVDIGTGTQDILLFNSAEPVENSFQLIMPSPTQIAAGRIRRATALHRPVALTGTVSGGGPCHWALEDHLRAGLAAYATPEAAATFDDDLDAVRSQGVTVVSADEIRNADAESVTLMDLDLGAIRAALAAFDVSGGFDGVAIGCLDHGASPPGYSDRLFRFEHLRRVVEARNDLRAFACLPGELPDYLTRARAVVACAGNDAPVVFLDTGPAAALGALQDETVRGLTEQVVMNLGNMHALCFHLRGTRVISLYEHHTGEISTDQVVAFTQGLIAGTLTHEDIFGSKGHGAYYTGSPATNLSPVVAVTGPQRGKVRGSALNPYFAVPHGDMMISGCFGLLWAFAERYPQHGEEIAASLGIPLALAS